MEGSRNFYNLVFINRHQNLGTWASSISSPPKYSCRGWDLIPIGICLNCAIILKLITEPPVLELAVMSLLVLCYIIFLFTDVKIKQKKI